MHIRIEFSDSALGSRVVIFTARRVGTGATKCNVALYDFKPR